MKLCAVAVVASICLALAAARGAEPEGANRFTYLDDFCDPYVFGLNSPRLITPQWVGEPGVEAVITIGIDDMREIEKYETYLRPILERLKKIDGRAPVSIFACKIDPQHPHLQKWLAEGLSIETHTADHPCPCLNDKGFDAAKNTFDRCVDQMSEIPGNHPVAFRFPCCDSLNTPSPRAFVEILGQKTPAGNFIQMSSSVCSILNEDDPQLPRSLVCAAGATGSAGAAGERRFARYAPFRNFVNRVYNYPYPFLIAGKIWEFPIGVPDDWQGFHLQQAANPQTLADMKAYVDAVVLKQGVVNITIHPYNWIRPEQMVDLVDYVDKTYGKRVKFLNFRECLERINKNLLAGQPVRAADGGDNGVRILDLNDDGFVDVLIGNQQRQQTRIWLPGPQDWLEIEFPTTFLGVALGRRVSHQVRLGVMRNGSVIPPGAANWPTVRERLSPLAAEPVLLLRTDYAAGAWRWNMTAGRWTPDEVLLKGLETDGRPVLLGRVNRDGTARDCGVRLVDLDRDGRCELIVSNPEQQAVFAWHEGNPAWRDGRELPPEDTGWRRLSFAPPEGAWLVDAQGRDAGTRLADIDGDGRLDVLTSSERGSGLWLFDSLKTGWSRKVFQAEPGSEQGLPKFVVNGQNAGVWLADRQVWLQNEETKRLADGVFHRSFNELLGDVDVPALSPAAALKSLQVPPGYRVELVAAEPLTMDPVAFDWGPDGKLWIVEMADYPLGLDGQGAPGGRLRYLADTDGDGSYDKSVLCLDKLPFPTGVMAWRDGVLVTAAPDLLFISDKNKDGVYDDREVLFTGFGEGNQQHRINGLRWSLDGWVHLANGDSNGKIRSTKTGQELDIRSRDLKFRPEDGAMDQATGISQYGRNRDDYDHWFGTNNSNPFYQFVLEDHYLRRNPHLAPPAPWVPVSDRSVQLFPLSRTLARFNSPDAANHWTSACSGMIYRDDVLGADVAGNVFVCEPVHNLVHREVVTRDGLYFRSAKPASERDSEFLRSTDNWFRPVMARTGPDGALWIADMYRAVIEHPQWIPKDWQARLDLRAGHDKGRIYRVLPKDQTFRRAPRLDNLGELFFVSALDTTNGTMRDMVQQYLCWRGDQTYAEPLARLARKSTLPAVRAQALWTLENLKVLTDAAIIAALQDTNAQVRAQAIRLAEPRLAGSEGLQTAVLKLVDDPDPDIALQLACTLGAWDSAASADALARLMLGHGQDPYLMAAALSSTNPRNMAPVVSRVMADPNAPATVVIPLLTVAAASQDGSALNQALEQVCKPREGGLDVGQLTMAAAVLGSLRRHGTPLDKLLAPQVCELLDGLLASARKAAVDAGTDVAVRTAAVKLLGQGGQAPDVDMLLTLLEPKQSADLQLLVVAAIEPSLNPGVADQLLAGWSGYSPALRGRVLDALLSRGPGVKRLLDRVEDGSIPAGEIDAARRQRLLESPSTEVAERAAKVLATGSGQRAQTVDEYQSVLAMPADAVRGKQVFLKRCSTCHVLDGQGHAVGAELAAMGNKSPGALLIAILDPNRAVESRYLNYVAQLDDGQVVSGILAAESGNSLTLRGPDGKDQVILRSDLEALRNTGKSLMPEGLEKDLTRQDLADVMAFVGGFTPPPKTFDGNTPQLVESDGLGIVYLNASKAAIYGKTLVLEPKYKNLGFWQSADDLARWTFEIHEAGTYKLVLDYACEPDLGNACQLEVDDKVLSGQVKSTGSWDRYRDWQLGQLALPAGKHTLVFRAAGPIKGALLDLRTIRVAPVR